MNSAAPKVPWPSKEHRPFLKKPPAASDPAGSTALDSVGWFAWHLEYTYVRGFFEVGMLVARHLQADDQTDNAMWIAMLYNFRHYLELSLKALITSCARLARESVPDDLNKEHGLMPLWTDAKHFMAKALLPRSSEPNPLPHIERCLNEFHQVDPSSETFRYPTDKKGATVEARLPLVDLPNLIESMLALEAFFMGCDAYADDLLSSRADSESWNC